eukprot:CAMPEP_0118945432 /NCGR_PEP_ID=MMETSP1169-20130426/42255_1 /TAXON_ID=36882 /ORGANISM="Pyramimonas obovata, Strain CCMP722" /LENGTH=256 /DNA_ID=CAMNT_0006891147 /DNA_START=133 /DNA_END=900 /DNA_ORIENTATION=+
MRVSKAREIFLFLTVSYVVAVLLSSDHEERVHTSLHASNRADKTDFSDNPRFRDNNSSSQGRLGVKIRNTNQELRDLFTGKMEMQLWHKLARGSGEQAGEGVEDIDGQASSESLMASEEMTDSDRQAGDPGSGKARKTRVGSVSAKLPLARGRGKGTKSGQGQGQGQTPAVKGQGQGQSPAVKGQKPDNSWREVAAVAVNATGDAKKVRQSKGGEPMEVDPQELSDAEHRMLRKLELILEKTQRLKKKGRKLDRRK